MSNYKERRTTAWTFVCYPESLPYDYEKRFRDMHISLAYIMHTMDTSADGIRVKDHIHVLIRYDSVKAYDQVAHDFAWTGIQYFEPVRSFHTMTRYLVHMDDPDKYQYSTDSVVVCGGLSLDFSRHFSPDEQMQMLEEITEWVEDNDVCDFSVLWNYCAKNNRPWLQLIMTKASYSINQYLRSRSYIHRGNSASSRL